MIDKINITENDSAFIFNRADCIYRYVLQCSDKSRMA